MMEQPLAGVRVTIDAGDLTVGEALDHLEDGTWYWQTLPDILRHYPQYDHESYWELPVSVHYLLAEHLTLAGLMSEGVFAKATALVERLEEVADGQPV